jgi:hypothetical protein
VAAKMKENLAAYRNGENGEENGGMAALALA